MDFYLASQTAFAVIASVGGAGAIIIFVGKWLANLTAEQIIKKKEFEFSQRIEQLKSNLDKKKYISKVRFDLEIEIYRLLSGVVLDMAEKCIALPDNSVNIHFEGTPLEKRARDSVDRANAACSKARKSILYNAPFIPKQIFDMFVDIHEECEEQSITSTYFVLGYKKSNSLKKDLLEFNERLDRIRQKKSVVSEKLREHIASLDILDK